MDNPWTLTLVGWLATYLLHSTVLLGTTWLILRCWPRLSDHSRETLWRVALFGGVLTTTLQLNLGLGPDVGRLELLAASEIPVNHTLPESAGVPATEIETAGLAVDQGTWLHYLLLLWAAGVVALVTLHTVRRLRLQSLLRNRTPVSRGPLRQQFHALARRAGLPPTIRLTTSTRIRCPMAFGILQPEVCLPGRMAAAMDFEQQACVLAHELAHLRSRDPLWLLLEAAVAWVGFLQPLNRLACRRLRELAEYRCDAWAVRHGGSHVHMAHALMTVAESYLGRVPAYAGVNAMALRGSALSRRVERIFADTKAPGPVGRGLLLGTVALGLAAIAWAVPAVSLTAPEHDSVEVLEVPDLNDPRLQKLSALERELRFLESELDSVRDGIAGTLQQSDVLSMLTKLQHRIRQLQSEQRLLWREASAAAHRKEYPKKPRR